MSCERTDSFNIWEWFKIEIQLQQRKLWRCYHLLSDLAVLHLQFYALTRDTESSWVGTRQNIHANREHIERATWYVTDVVCRGNSRNVWDCRQLLLADNVGLEARRCFSTSPFSAHWCAFSVDSRVGILFWLTFRMEVAKSEQCSCSPQKPAAMRCVCAIITFDLRCMAQRHRLPFHLYN